MTRHLLIICRTQSLLYKRDWFLWERACLLWKWHVSCEKYVPPKCCLFLKQSQNYTTCLKKVGGILKFRACNNSATATPYLLCGLFFVILRQNRPIFDHFCEFLISDRADISSRHQTALIIKKKMLYKIPTNWILYNIFR